MLVHWCKNETYLQKKYYLYRLSKILTNQHIALLQGTQDNAYKEYESGQQKQHGGER